MNMLRRAFRFLFPYLVLGLIFHAMHQSVYPLQCVAMSNMQTNVLCGT